jgi:hypothetical protein
MKRLFLLAAAMGLLHTSVRAQSSDFCEAVTAVMNDAPNEFRNIRGRMVESNMNSNMWASPVKVPGSLGHRVVQAMGLFYEAAFLQTTNRDDVRPAYDKLKQQLTQCLEPMGYKVSYQENFTAGLGDYKKVVLMKDLKPGLKSEELPPHATIEVTYSKDVGKFTVVMFLFQH